MSALPWIKVWTRVTGHPKVERLERVLGIPDALGVVLRLWAWTADFHPDGMIPDADGPEAARFAIGPADREAAPPDVLAALAEVGLLEKVPGALRVHDWETMQTQHVHIEERRRELGKIRAARWRSRRRNARVTLASRSDSVTPSRSDDAPAVETSRSTDQDKPTEPQGIDAASRSVTRDVTRDVTRYFGPKSRGEEETKNYVDRTSVLLRANDPEINGPSARTQGENGAKRTARGQGEDLDATRRWPLTAALLVAVKARGFVLEWPRSEGTTDRLERTIAEVGADVALDRVWSVIVSERALRVAPKQFVGWYVDTIRGTPAAPRRPPRGGYVDRWQDWLTAEEREQARAELAAIHPDLAGAPLNCEGDPAIHPVDQIAAFNARWRAKVEGRQ